MGCCAGGLRGTSSSDNNISSSSSLGPYLVEVWRDEKASAEEAVGCLVVRFRDGMLSVRDGFGMGNERLEIADEDEGAGVAPMEAVEDDDS